MKFDNYRISDTIKSNIAKQGYKKPTDIQFKCIPAILKRDDVLAIAQTGTGKTAAFAIPILDLLTSKSKSRRPEGVRCLVMAPTHELALQIEKVFEELGKGTHLVSYCIHGGVEQDAQIRQLQQGVDVLVATPGRMFDLVSQKALVLKNVEILVLDEADHMLDLGFIKDIKDLMRHIPRRRQTLFFSATIDDKIKKLAYGLVSKPVRIQISPKDPVSKNIEHAVAHIEMDDKRFFLESLLREHEDKKFLVFVRTKVRAERVFKAMSRVSIDTMTIHSDKTQQERDHVMDNFRNGKCRVLIATDLTARGIDIPLVDYVVNYDLPESVEGYVHRVGRTGRGREKGQALSFCSTEENELLIDIEEKLAKPIQKIELSHEDYQMTIGTSLDTHEDWKTLMKQAAIEDTPKKKKPRKKKK